MILTEMIEVVQEHYDLISVEEDVSQWNEETITAEFKIISQMEDNNQ